MGCEGGSKKQPTCSSREERFPRIWQSLGICHPKNVKAARTLRGTKRLVAPTLNPHAGGWGSLGI